MLVLVIISALVSAILCSTLPRNVHLRSLVRLWAQAPLRRYLASTREARQ